ncbi:MAG: hypothetical protein HPM95_05235 [Alphaproteobacteria bacterium]|nr:hypothetical protein [Alphaproteobacteria bacterium]
MLSSSGDVASAVFILAFWKYSGSSDFALACLRHQQLFHRAFCRGGRKIVALLRGQRLPQRCRSKSRTYPSKSALSAQVFTINPVSSIRFGEDARGPSSSPGRAISCFAASTEVAKYADQQDDPGKEHSPPSQVTRQSRRRFWSLFIRIQPDEEEQ